MSTTIWASRGSSGVQTTWRREPLPIGLDGKIAEILLGKKYDRHPYDDMIDGYGL